MNKLNQIFNIFLFFIGMVITFASLRLPYGKMAKPGPGFLPFWCGFLISVISLVIIISYFRKENKNSKEIESAFREINHFKILAAIGSMLLYAFIFEKTGFILSNFLFLLCIIRLVWKRGWGFSVIVSSLLTLGSHIIFNVWMKIPMPSDKLIIYIKDFL